MGLPSMLLCLSFEHSDFVSTLRQFGCIEGHSPCMGYNTALSPDILLWISKMLGPGLTLGVVCKERGGGFGSSHGMIREGGKGQTMASTGSLGLPWPAGGWTGCGTGMDNLAL